MKTWRLIVGYILWLVVGAVGLWYVPKPWNLDVGILFILVLFALPDLLIGRYSGRFLKNEAAQFDWAKIQFVAWYSVVIGGLLAFEAIRLKDGIINPLNVVVDGTVALLLGTSALVSFARSLKGLVVNEIRNQARNDAELASLALFHTVFMFLTLVFVLSQAYLLWITLKATVPALLINYPTISWGFALIYFVAGIGVSIIDVSRGFGSFGGTQSELHKPTIAPELPIKK